MDGGAQPVDVSAHQDQTRALVRAMLALTGLSPTALAKAASLTPSTLNRFLHHPVRHTLSQRTLLALMTETMVRLKDRPVSTLDSGALAALAPAVPLYERAILDGMPELGPTLAALKGARAAAADPAVLPVLTQSTTGVDIEREDFRAAPLTAPRPPFIASDRRAFALLVSEGSMSPRYEVGDMVYVSPAQALEGGKIDIVFERAAGGLALGRLVSITADKLRVSTLSPHATETFPRDKVRGVYRVVGMQRLAS